MFSLGLECKEQICRVIPGYTGIILESGGVRVDDVIDDGLEEPFPVQRPIFPGVEEPHEVPCESVPSSPLLTTAEKVTYSSFELPLEACSDYRIFLHCTAKFHYPLFLSLKCRKMRGM